MNAIRKLDKLGRIVIPIDARNYLGVMPDDEVNIQVTDDKAILFNGNPKHKTSLKRFCFGDLT
ncbi:MAG: AbrB/MazE/SpoVT family DNA-binding domain-containing protein [Clostridiales bacterium]|nr:AbrB/MazE/SpoVT family DNA-binding domain-containing protein [Clostridiales bacterium]